MKTDIMTLEEVANYLKLKPQTIYTWAQEKRIPDDVGLPVSPISANMVSRPSSEVPVLPVSSGRWGRLEGVRRRVAP